LVWSRSFFAVSGFLITGILLSLRNCDSPYKTFYWRRALRIFPPYYLVFLIIEALTFLHGERPTHNEQIAAGLLLSSLSRGFSLQLMWSRLFLHAGFYVPVQQLFHQGFEEFRYAKGIFWSLSVEEFFYLIWAPVVLRGSRRLILGFCILPLIVCPVFRALNHAPGYPEAFNFLCRFDSLAVGGCVALLFAAVRRGHVSERLLNRSILLALPASAVFLLVLIWRCGAFDGVEIHSSMVFATFGFSMLAVFCASVVAACARWSGSGWTRFLRFRPLVGLGTISYMVYLIHIAVYTSAGLALSYFGVRTHVLGLQGLLAIPFVIGLAALSWRFFESPILALKDKRFGAATSRGFASSEGPAVAG